MNSMKIKFAGSKKETEAGMDWVLLQLQEIAKERGLK